VLLLWSGGASIGDAGIRRTARKTTLDISQ
jgi:hypothetical protein